MSRAFKPILSTRLTRPLLVGTLTGKKPVKGQLSQARKAKVDVLEIRLDTFPFARQPLEKALSSFQKLVAQCRKAHRKTLLLTFRAASEAGGRGVKVSDAVRSKVLGALMKRGDWVDVEIRRPAFSRAMAKTAAKNKVLVVFSRHHFKGIGSFSSIQKDARKARQLGPGIFKVAAAPETEKDLSRFLFLGKDLPHPSKVFIPMGEKNKLFRVAAFSFGSVLSYAHLGASAAPGQMSAVQARKLIRSLYGR